MPDIKNVVADAENLLEQKSMHTATPNGHDDHALRTKALSHLKRAKDKASHAQIIALEESKKAAHATDEYVRGHPWHSIGIAAGVGLLLGLLLNRR